MACQVQIFEADKAEREAIEWLAANPTRYEPECQGHYPKLGCPGSQRQVVEMPNTKSLVAHRHTRAKVI